MWIWYGEVVHLLTVSQSQESNVNCEDRMKDMILDIREDSFQWVHVYDSLKDYSK